MIHILGGGTVFHVRPHLAVSAPAYGQTARWIKTWLENNTTEHWMLHLTRMANKGHGQLETNEDDYVLGICISVEHNIRSMLIQVHHFAWEA